jgi:hypothetical protein
MYAARIFRIYNAIAPQEWTTMPWYNTIYLPSIYYLELQYQQLHG